MFRRSTISKSVIKLIDIKCTQQQHEGRLISIGGLRDIVCTLEAVKRTKERWVYRMGDFFFNVMN